MSGETQALEVSNLGISFGGVKALDDVCFSIGAGEVAAIVGPNGAGKSTLLNSLNGLVRPDTGSVSVMGTDISAVRPSEIPSLGVGRSFQHPHLLEEETVLENLKVGGHVVLANRPALLWNRAGHPEREVGESCLQLLEDAELPQYAHRQVAGLPYGIRKLVDILRALVSQPRVLLLDEPSSGLSEADRFHLLEVLRRFHSRDNATIVLVEHHMDVVRSFADRVIALTHGAVATDARVADVDELEVLGVATVGAMAGASDGSPITATEAGRKMR